LRWSDSSNEVSGEPGAVQFFVSAPRSIFRDWATELPSWTESSRAANDLPRIELIRAESSLDRLRFDNCGPADVNLEVVLHASRNTPYIIDSFRAYLQMLGISGDIDRRLYAGRLCFIPVHASQDKIEDLAKFSFLRVARIMPKLRHLSPVRSYSAPSPAPVVLPSEPPLNLDVRAAIFDGGLPDMPYLSPWVTALNADGVGEAHVECLTHGCWVTSALLFGPLAAGETANRPFAHVDHYRVLDTDFDSDDDLFDVLTRIQNVLQHGRYKFVNLSIGPDLTVEDNDVHAWTAVLDELFSSGEILATVAAGNNGQYDADAGLNRILVPSDCVNGLTVGASDSSTSDWTRAPYSAVGPGRSPGIIKPDLLAFGGGDAVPFSVLDPQDPLRVNSVSGTSFAAPSALRLGLGVRAHFGDSLSPLAIKAILIHGTEEGDLERHEQGWGRVPADLRDLVICPDCSARIVYQGELNPAQHLRTPIPLPETTLAGNVTITATICFATSVDPEDPGCYTRSGLEIVFRPHDEKFGKTKDDGGNWVISTHPKTAAFFQRRDYATETEHRRDAHKWETVLHRKVAKRGSSLKNPVFDIHLAPRAFGAPTFTTDRIRYALVVTVESRRNPELYDQIMQRYRTYIRPLTPLIQIPIQT
ncbi:MAG: S8 family peptidase, partial [Bacteroidales bacterium]|nr:S8 family peptidase [Candidatus Latescibacterota bacterium]